MRTASPNRQRRTRGPQVIGSPDWREFSPDQWRCIVSSVRYLIISAVIRSGKTRTAAKAFYHRLKRDYRSERIEALSREEPIRYWVGAPTYRLNIPQKIYLVPMLRDSGLIDWKAQGQMKVGASVTKGGGAVHLVGNRLIEFVSLDEADSLVGATVRAGWISEAARCDEKAVDEFLGRMGNFDDAWLVGDTSPYGRGWFYRRYIEPMMLNRFPDGELVQWSYDAILDWIDSPYFAGRPFLHRSEFETKRAQLPEWMFRRDYLGLWENATGQVYANWSPKNVVARSLPYMRGQGFRLHLAADLNYTTENPACWLLLAHHPRTKAIHVLQEFQKYVGVDVSGYADALTACARQHGCESIVLDPSIQNAIKQRIAAHGFRVTGGTTKGSGEQTRKVVLGISQVSEMIGQGLLTAEPCCSNLFNEIAEYRWAVDKQGNATGEPDKHSFDPHRLDALRYAVLALSRTWK